MATRTGVFIEWNEEQSTVAREDVGTIRERYILKRVEIVTKRALWSNEISPSTIAAAERYAQSDSTDDRKLRVAVVPAPAKPQGGAERTRDDRCGCLIENVHPLGVGYSIAGHGSQTIGAPGTHLEGGLSR